jgi:hypothetical protein
MRKGLAQGLAKSPWDFMRSVWSSKAGLAIAPLQDLLNLSVEGRMNVPGVAAGNWRWRCTEEMIKPLFFERLRELTFSSGADNGIKRQETNPRNRDMKEIGPIVFLVDFDDTLLDNHRVKADLQETYRASIRTAVS